MFLERLEIQGFKSFTNKTVLQFSQGKNSQSITAIVGPNGTGKSNIVDAIRWVLGEQSIKILRGKKASDVIFFGSKKRISLGLAEVSLYLNNNDKVSDLDYDQIVITRRVFRDGEGEYLINKAKVRLQDILLLLAKTNFGQRTYGIIGQGMVDSILNSSYADRQEFFSEAANIKQYQIKREQSLAKLEKTEENLRQADLLLTEIEPRLKTLTRQIKRLEKREVLEEELREFEISLYSSLWQKIKLKFSELEKQIQNKKAEEEKYEKKIAEINRELENLRKKRGRSESFSQLQKELETLSEKKNLLLQEKNAIQNLLPLSEKEDSQELAWQERKLKNLEEEEKRLVEEKEGLEKQIKKYKEEYKTSQEEAAHFDKQIAELNQKLTVSAPAGERDLRNFFQELQELVKNLSLEQKKLIEKLNSKKEPFDSEGAKILAEKIRFDLNKLEERFKEIPSESEEEKEDINLQISRLFEERKVSTERLINAKVNAEIIDKKLVFIEERNKNNQNEKDLILTQVNLLKERFDLAGKKEGKDRQDKIFRLKERLSILENEIKQIKNKLTSFNQQEEQREDEFFALQEKIRAEQNFLDCVRESLSEAKINLAKIETHREDLEKEIVAELGSWDKLKDEIRSETEENKLQLEIQRLKRQLETIGGIDEETVKEYKETKERFDFLNKQSTDLKEAISSLENIIEELDNLIKKQFEISFERINEQFNKYFRILFDGGSAKLVKKSQKPREEELGENGVLEKTIAQKFERGREILIEIEATPPGKRIKSISMLSGGERALTALALICAIIANNPSPFIVLDEVDAALDEANSRRFAKILKDLSSRTQIITITHNRATMEIAQELYGVTMNEEGVSKLISLKLEEAKKN